VSGVAAGQATFNLPFLSSQPCVVMTLALPLLACIAAIGRRVRSGAVAPAPARRHG
jgi:hypothetical protein